MKRPQAAILTLAILAIMPALPCFSQPRLLETEHGLRAGDSLTVQVVEQFSPGVPGRGRIWDLSGVGTISESPAWCYAEDGGMTVSCLDALFHYTADGGTLRLAGFENRRALASFHAPLPVLRWPVSYGDSLLSDITGGAVWCERTFMTVRGTASSRADAYGTLILPGGDTLRNVMRIHSRRQVRLHEIDSVRTWDALRRMTPAALAPSPDTPDETHEAYLWLAPGCRYPVAALLSYGTPRGSGTAALLCPPAVQYAMEQPDPVNETVRLALQSGTYSPDGSGDAGQGTPLLTYTAVQDTSSRTVSVSCSVDGGGTLSLVLTDAAGVVYDSMTARLSPGETRSFSLSYAALPRGQFVLHLSAGSERHTEKFTNV